MVVEIIGNMKKLKYNVRTYLDKELDEFFELDNEESKMLEVINKIYTIKVTKGRFTIPVEIRRKFGFFGKKVEVEADIQNDKLFIDFKKIKKIKS